MCDAFPAGGACGTLGAIQDGSFVKVNGLQFNTSMSFRYGRFDRLSPTVRRLVAPNPGPFTFYGTGVYVVGTGRVAVIDPGPNAPAHIHALLAGLGQETVEAILVTHTHSDHSPGAALLKEKTGAPVYGFGSTLLSERAEEDTVVVEAGRDLSFRPDHKLKDGDTIEGDTWALQALHTPGHTSDHLCYAYDAESALFTGDHVMGWSTTVIAPPDGDMDAYIMSLENLLPRDDAILYPTHGSPITSPHDFLIELINHRHEREQQILRCLARNIESIEGIVSQLYSHVPTELHAAAACSVWAHLIALCRRGVAFAEKDDQSLDGRYRLASI